MEQNLQCEPKETLIKRRGILSRNPWIFVVAAFAALIAAWTTLIVIAVKNRPAPLEPPALEAESSTAQESELTANK